MEIEMKHVVRILGMTILSLLLGTGCSHHDKSQSSSLSFRAVQAQILDAKCASCHSVSDPKGGLNVTSHKALLGSGMVVPGNPGASRLYASISNGTMPPGERLPGDQVTAIFNWITEGAKNDGDFVIKSVVPKSGGAGVQTAVKITGDGFKEGMTVWFGSSAATNIVVNSPTEITLTTPSRSAGWVDILMKAAPPDTSSTITRGAFFFGGGGAGGLNITDVSPRSGIPGTLILMTGFGLDGVASATVGGSPCTNLHASSPNSLTCNVADRSQSGSVDIVLTDGTGQTVEFLQGYFYTVPASFTSLHANILTPKCQSCHASTAATTGGGVAFMDTSVTGDNYASLMGAGIILPRDPDGSPLYITIRNGSHRGALLSTDEILLIRNWVANGCWNDKKPVVDSVSPTSGSSKGSTAVTINGSGFFQNAQVSIGGASCLGGVISPDGRQITNCTTTPHAAGAGKVVVINGAAGGVPSNASIDTINFTFVDPPVISSVSPAQVKSSNTGSLTGSTTVTITGSNLKSGSTVQIGARTCLNITFIGETSITCQPPPAMVPASLLDVIVTNPDGQRFTLPSSFNYVSGDKPTLSSISPSFAYTNIASTHTLTGTGYLQDTVNTPSRPRVDIGARNIAIGAGDYLSAQSLSVPNFTPNTNQGGLPQAVRVTNLDGLSSSETVSLAVFIKPTITSLSVNSYSAASPPGGITVSGTGFVQTNQAGATTNLSGITIGGNPCTIVNGTLTATSVTCFPPACSDSLCTGGAYSVRKNVTVTIPALGNTGDTPHSNADSNNNVLTYVP